MSSYPPPPPFDPNAARNAIRAQRAMLKAQARAQRQMLKLQRRALRRRSILGPLILLALGVVFLLAQFDRIAWPQAMDWYSRWWPAVLIAAGLVLIAEWAIDQRRLTTQAHPRTLGGGVVLLLILLAITGIAARGIQYGLDWENHAFGNGSNLNHLFGDRHDGETTLSTALPAGAALVIHNPHGDVTLAGSSDDGEVHVSVHTQAYAWKESDADAKARRLQPTFSQQGKDLVLDVASVEGGQADLTIELPRATAITLEARSGDVNISDIAAPIVVSANRGDTELSAITGPVNLHVQDDDANITLHSITGPVLIDGRGGDTEVSDIHGELTMQGDFFGSTHLQRIDGAVRFQTSRTRFTAARLDDEFSVSRDTLDASALLGPVLLKTSDKNITLDRVAGSVDLVNRNGSVSVTHPEPLAAISIQNTHGSVDLGLASGDGFQLSAQTRNGDMENDFGLTPQRSGSSRSLHGNIAGGGPAVTISTTDGDVTVRRSTVAPLPPEPPPAPPITFTPPPQPPQIKPPVPPKPPRPPVGRTF